MLFTHLIVSALCLGAGIAANPRSLTTGNGEAALSALQTLQTDVQTYTAVVKENAAHTNFLNPNDTAVTAIQDAVKNIVTSISIASQSIQVAKADKRQLPTDPAATAVAIETIVNNLAFQIVGLGLSLLGSITGSQAWQHLTNPLLEGFSELTTILGSLLGNIPGFQAISDALASALSSLPA